MMVKRCEHGKDTAFGCSACIHRDQEQGLGPQSRWQPMRMSTPGSMEWEAVVPNIVEPEYRQKLRISIFCIKENQLDRRFRAHVYLNGDEAFRLFAPTIDEAKARSVEGIRAVLAAFLSALPQGE